MRRCRLKVTQELLLQLLHIENRARIDIVSASVNENGVVEFILSGGLPEEFEVTEGKEIPNAAGMHTRAVTKLHIEQGERYGKGMGEGVL